MTKALIASACGLLLFVSGCGSGGSDKRKTACAQAVTAMNAYHLAGQAVAPDFSNRAGLKKVVVAAAGFRAKLKKLAPATSASERKQLEELTGTLEEHERLLTAVATKQLTLAHELDTQGFEEALDDGQANFKTICKVPAT